jgi:hypothetical protein
MVMPEADVIRALHDKQKELTTNINRLEQQIVEYRAGLAHLEEVVRLFDPTIQPEAVHPGRRTAQRMWFRPGESLRLIYDVLREAPHPMATRDIAERVMAAKGIGMADDHSRVLIQKTIHASLSRAKKTVERVTADGVVRWRVI